MHHKDSASDALQQYGKLQKFLLVGENAVEYSHYHPQYYRAYRRLLGS